MKQRIFGTVMYGRVRQILPATSSNACEPSFAELNGIL
jgi:hypothetical protein